MARRKKEDDKAFEADFDAFMSQYEISGQRSTRDRRRDAELSDNPYGVEIFSVMSPTGREVNLQSKDEADWYDNQRARYMTHNKFENQSDLNDLDRLLTLEVMVYRWSQWITQGFDYSYGIIDQQQLKSNIADYSREIRLIKDSLGIDKKTREKDQGEDLAAYINKLLARAKEFGYHRNNQYEKAVTLIHELRSLVLTYDRCDDEEREELDLSHESIIGWVRENLITEWDQIDEAFRKNQSMWVRSL